MAAHSMTSQRVPEKPGRSEDGEPSRLTAAFGVSASVHVADKALYVGKDKGRNQVVALPEESFCA